MEILPIDWLMILAGDKGLGMKSHTARYQVLQRLRVRRWILSWKGLRADVWVNAFYKSWHLWKPSQLAFLGQQIAGDPRELCEATI